MPLDCEIWCVVMVVCTIFVEPESESSSFWGEARLEVEAEEICRSMMGRSLTGVHFSARSGFLDLGVHILTLNLRAALFAEKSELSN